MVRDYKAQKKSDTKSDFNFFGYPLPDLLSQGSYANVRLT